MNKNLLTLSLAVAAIACAPAAEKQCFNDKGVEILCPTTDVSDKDDNDDDDSEDDDGDNTPDNDTDNDVDGDDDGGVDTGSPYDIPANAPAFSVKNGELLIAKKYLSGSCAELRGTFPNTSWSDGPRLNSGSVDGFYSLDVSGVRDGTYDITAESVDCNTGNGTGNWADYGASSDKLKAIDTEGLAYVQCQNTSCVTPGSCKLLVVISTVNGTKRIDGAGNMDDARDCD